MIIRNIYFRLFLGLYSILLGLIFLKLHHDREKDNAWGMFFRTLSEMGTWNKAGADYSWVCLFLGWMSIIGGLIAIFYGFRLTMVG